MVSDDTSETSTLKQQTPELECLHQCVRCGILYFAKKAQTAAKKHSIMGNVYCVK